MESYDLFPKPGDAERIRESAERLRVWRVEFARPVERMFSTTAQVAAVRLVDAGVPNAGILGGHSLRQRPTDREGVWLMEFGAPVCECAVEHENMAGFMSAVRANALHGRYRECGTEAWHEF